MKILLMHSSISSDRYKNLFWCHSSAPKAAKSVLTATTTNGYYSERYYVVLPLAHLVQMTRSHTDITKMSEECLFFKFCFSKFSFIGAMRQNIDPRFFVVTLSVRHNAL